MEGSVFVLSGEEHTLPSAEVFAVVGTYSAETCEKLSRRVVYSKLKDPTTIWKITERAAYTRFGGELVSISSSPESLVDRMDEAVLKDKSFAVRSESVDKQTCGEIGAKIKERSHAKVSLDKPDCVFQAEKLDDGRFVLGVSTYGVKEFSWRERRPRARRFFLPSAIYPKLARLLVNLARVKEGDYFVDPFCGTGSLLIESSVMGIKTLGIDVKRWIARGAWLNLEAFSLEFDSIMRADSTFRNLPFSRVDGIATDVPYGRASSTTRKTTGQIIKEFLAGASGVLNSNKYLVLMHPSHVDLDYTSSFELTEEHLLYVHRNLTRAISVLKRR